MNLTAVFACKNKVIREFMTDLTSVCFFCANSSKQQQYFEKCLDFNKELFKVSKTKSHTHNWIIKDKVSRKTQALRKLFYVLQIFCYYFCIYIIYNCCNVVEGLLCTSRERINKKGIESRNPKAKSKVCSLHIEDLIVLLLLRFCLMTQNL